jgi:hypothetical protein
VELDIVFDGVEHLTRAHSRCIPPGLCFCVAFGREIATTALQMRGDSVFLPLLEFISGCNPRIKDLFHWSTHHQSYTLFRLCFERQFGDGIYFHNYLCHHLLFQRCR